MSARIIAYCLLLNGCMLLAQAPADTAVGTPGSAPSMNENLTIQGCLESASDNYSLTDIASGKTYRIAGDTTKLKQHIGQKVEISGGVPNMGTAASANEQSTGETLVLGDVKEIASDCKPAVPQSWKWNESPVLIAQRPVAPDANPDLNSSAPFSSNASDTSAQARRNSTVSTQQQRTSKETNVTGHAGQHQMEVDTSTTGSRGQSTPPTNSSPGGFNATNLHNNDGSQAQSGRAGQDSAERTRPATANPAVSGNTPEDANRAAEAAGRAEMHTNPQSGQTGFSTMRGAENNASPRANPKVNRKPNPNQSGTNNETK